MVYDPYNMLLDLVFWYFIEDFCIYIYEKYWSVVFFSCSVFGISVILASQNELECVPSPSISLEKVEKDWR